MEALTPVSLSPSTHPLDYGAAFRSRPGLDPEANSLSAAVETLPGSTADSGLDTLDRGRIHALGNSQCSHVFFKLLNPAGTQHYGRYVRFLQAPGEGQLGLIASASAPDRGKGRGSVTSTAF